jgi:hypothetical protein
MITNHDRNQSQYDLSNEFQVSPEGDLETRFWREMPFQKVQGFKSRISDKKLEEKLAAKGDTSFFRPFLKIG